MKSSTLWILYVIQKSKINKSGKCPIRCRITVDRNIKEFSTGLFIKPENWDINNQLAKDQEDSDYIYDNITLIRQKLQDSYLKLKLAGASFSVADILSKYKGESTIEELGVLAAFNLHNEHIKKLVGKEIQEVTYSKYLETYIHIESFIKWKFKASDILLKQLKGSFLDDLQYYLVTEKSFQQSTINKVIQRFRKVIKYVIVNEYLGKDPFLAFKNKTGKKEIVFLHEKNILSDLFRILTRSGCRTGGCSPRTLETCSTIGPGWKCLAISNGTIILNWFMGWDNPLLS